MWASGTIVSGFSWAEGMSKRIQNAFDNELLVALIAVTLAGFATLMLWVIFGS